MIITGIMLIIYKPAYSVVFKGEDFGYINSKKQIEEAIKEYENYQKGNIAIITLNETPEYEFTFVKRAQETNEENLLIAVREDSTVVYKTYAIALDGEIKTYVKTIDEAEEVIDEIKAKHDGDLELDIVIQEVYTENTDEIEAVEVAIAEANMENTIEEKIAMQGNSVNGIILQKPAEGTLSSRFGSRWGRAHTGLDIAASTGTPIYAAASGTVTNSTYSGGYGNLIKISHGNGVETYYSHCSQVYVSAGQEVNAGDLIGLVRSTGNSTGPHLHLEVRINGVPQNPQNYLYK